MYYDYRGIPYDEFRESEKAMSKQEYPQAGPPYDKTTYMGRIRNKMDAADNEFAKVSCDYRSAVSETVEIIANLLSAVSILSRMRPIYVVLSYGGPACG